MKSIRVNGKNVMPSKVVCIGRNYVEHINELGNEIPAEMVVFMKPNSAISHQLISYHEEPIHYEGELCFLVKNGAFSAVGFGLDLTKRDLQSQLKDKGLPWERAKAFNGSAVFSEFVPMAEITAELSFTLTINGGLKQSGNIAHTIYKPNEILTELKKFLTLNDGDIVMTGTPKGVGVIHQGDRFVGEVKYKEATLVTVNWLSV